VFGGFTPGGYTETFAESRFYGVFSLYAVPHLRPAAPTKPPNGRSEFASISATSDKSASFPAQCGGRHPDHFLALVLRIGNSGASPQQWFRPIGLASEAALHDAQALLAPGFWLLTSIL
jgi:hypothetical protein